MLRLLVAWWGAVLARGVGAPWARATLGVLGVLMGAALVVRPLTSLDVLVLVGAAACVVSGLRQPGGGVRPGRPTWAARAAGLLLVVAGLAAVALRDEVLQQMALVCAAVLVGGGTRTTVRALRPRRRDHQGARADRMADGLLGPAAIGLGLLAVRWPDVAVLAVAAVFGLRVVQLGLVLLVTPRRMVRLRHRLRGTARTWSRPGWVRPWWIRARLLRAALALTVVVGLGGVSLALDRREPAVGAFYDPPASAPDAPGVLLRSAPFSADVAGGVTARQILYTTTDARGDPTVASALVLVSAAAPAGARPVIAWAHGTTGFARRCAPTVLASRYGAGALPAVDQILSRGWVLVATDYPGLGTAGPEPYLVGRGEAYAVLDAVRAARQLDAVHLGRRTVVWGHSQGGLAALWAGQVAPTYAPDVPLAGVAALAPAAQLVELAADLDEVSGGTILASYILAAYSAIYDDVDVADYVRPAARPVLAADAARCLPEPEVYVSALSSLIAGERALRRSLATGPLGRRLRDNVPRGVITAPTLIAQGLADDLILPSVQEGYVEQRCALGGGPLTYREYADRDHTGLIDRGSPLVPDLVRWTAARLAGGTATGTC